MQFLYSEVKIMEIKEVLNIIKAFFDAILKIFGALGLTKKDEAADNEDASGNE